MVLLNIDYQFIGERVMGNIADLLADPAKSEPWLYAVSKQVGSTLNSIIIDPFSGPVQRILMMKHKTSGY